MLLMLVLDHHHQQELKLKNQIRTTSIGNDKAAADHIELTDGVRQHLIGELITQFKVNRYSVEMNKIKLSQKDSLKKVHGRVVE